MSREFRLCLYILLGCLLGNTCYASETKEAPAVSQSSQSQKTLNFAEEIENLARNQPEQAVQLSHQALSFLENHPNPHVHGRVLNGASYALSFIGKYDLSMQKAKEAERLATTHHLPDILARSQMLQGNILKNIGEYPRALAQYRLAATFYADTQNELYLGYCYNNIANTYKAAGRLESALEYYQLYKTILNDGSVNLGIGGTYLLMGEVEKALRYFDEAFLNYQEEKDLLGMALALNNQGDAYLHILKPLVALKFFEKAITIATENKQNYTLEFTYRGKARALYQLEDFNQAMRWAQKGYQIAVQRNETSAVIDNLLLQADIYRGQGDLLGALETYQEARRLEQINKVERDSTQLAVMQALFESEAKAAEIEALEERNKLLSLEKEIEKEQVQYARLLSGVLIGVLFLLTLWAYIIYRDKRRLAYLYADLGEAKIQAEQAAKSKSVFLANMSHEIRTPLTSIIGYSEGILHGDVEPEAQQRVLEIISENGNHLLHVINDILDLTKIEANKLEFELIPTPLLPLLAQIESVTGKRARDKGLTFELNHKYPLPSHIITDPTRLRQILFNLTNNAIKFTNNGSISLNIESVNNTLQISVKDTGIGINQMQLKKLFNPFNQADGSINRRFGGSGLGLSISQHLAKGLGGDITVLSQEGIGSMFTLKIPLKEAEHCRWIDQPNQDEHNEFTRKVTSAPTTSYKHARVLLAEDHPNNRDLITLMLKRMEIDVTAVENGMLACDAALNKQFDLIFMDIQMPVMDGVLALKKIRSFDRKTPIVALTANNMKHEIEQYFAEGFDDHLPKPIPRNDLLQVLEKYLKDEQEPDLLRSSNDREMGLLISNYIEQLTQYLSEANEAWKQSDLQKLKDVAHKIKGSAGGFGFTPVGVYFAEIEQLIKDNSQEVMQEKVVSALSQTAAYLHIPHVDLAQGICNHNLNVDDYFIELGTFARQTNKIFTDLNGALNCDIPQLQTILKRLRFQSDILALTEVVELCNKLESFLPGDYQKDEVAGIMDSLSQQFQDLRDYFAHPTRLNEA